METSTENPVVTRTLRVAVCGAKGKMGREVVKAVLEAPDLRLVGAVVSDDRNEPVNDFFNTDQAPDLRFESDLSAMLHREKPDVCVEFTHPDVVLGNALRIIEAGCRPIIGTTGLDDAALAKVDGALTAARLGGMVVPNFAIGAVLMMMFARDAARYFDHAEIIELHHNRKADAPSGTALKTAALMRESRANFGTTNAPEKETVAGARGASDESGIHIHSVRLPGFIAHQEVIFGSPGQILTIRHDSADRACFMPGVLLAVRKVMTLSGLVYGLEHIL